MRRTVTLDEIRKPPDRDDVPRLQGIPADVRVSDPVRAHIETARSLYAELADPRGIFEEVSASEFEIIYRGEGLNAAATPLDLIRERADWLVLFALTLGERLSERTAELFAENEPVLGYMLDTIASERADSASELIAEDCLEILRRAGLVEASTRALAYSPGYCGWDVTGQRKLFDFLRPEEIGITLNETCLMRPMKSVSGVLVIGPADIHDFDDDFDFCDECAVHGCRRRIASSRVKMQGRGATENPGG